MNLAIPALDALKTKYQAQSFRDDSPILELILAKAELAIALTDLEKYWLQEQDLWSSLDLIEKQQNLGNQLADQLQENFQRLSSKYKAIGSSSWRDNNLYIILLKLDREEVLTRDEIRWLRNHPRSDIQKLVVFYDKTRDFIRLKSDYGIAQRPDLSLDSPLAEILQKLESREKLTPENLKYLEQQGFPKAIEIFKQQEAARKAVFKLLLEKYQVSGDIAPSLATSLEKTLQSIDSGVTIDERAIEWLVKNNFLSVHFAALKLKYHVPVFPDLSLPSHLYQLLKNVEAGKLPLSEPDINFLRKRKLNETIDLVREQHLSILKNKYDLSDYRSSFFPETLYEILQKLDNKQRLSAIDVAWLRLKENRFELWTGKIYQAYHILEAEFYEREYQTSKNSWNLPSASSHWRKAEQPKKALQLTENLNIEKIKPNKLKSAILTSRGGAYRDLATYDRAENCAEQARVYQPDSHHPYTLLGAICFNTGRYSEGYDWFEEARKRGAKSESIDSELRQIIEKAKGEERQKVIDYLLKKDPRGYAWVKQYEEPSGSQDANAKERGNSKVKK